MRRHAFEVFAGLLLSLCCTPLPAFDGGSSLGQFDHTAWTLKDGAPSETFALAQTRDGYLWLGTANGLFRFDGVKFERYQPPAGQPLPKISVQSLLATPAGELWIGYTLGGTSVLRDGHLDSHPLLIGRHTGTVWCLASDPDGSVWAASGNGIAHFTDGAWHGIEPALGFAAHSAYRVFFDRARNLWVSTDDDVYKKARGSDRFVDTGVVAGPDAAFEQGAGDTVWVSDAHGVRVLDPPAAGAALRPYALRDDDVTDIRLDDQGGLWATSSRHGVLYNAQPQAAPGNVERPPSTTSERAMVSMKDREGTIWTASPAGLDRFRRQALRRASLPDTFGFYALSPGEHGAILVGTEGDGLQRLEHGTLSRVRDVPLERIASVLRGADGKLWLGGMPALGYLENGRFVSIAWPAALATSTGDTQTMALGADGTLWVQSINNRPVMRWRAGQWSTIPDTPGTQDSAVILASDAQGRIWSGYLSGLIVIYDGDTVTRLPPGDWGGVGNVLALHPAGRDVWIGGAAGLGVSVDGQARRVRFAGSAPIEGISGIYRLDDGSLWLNTLQGIVRVAADEVAHVLASPAYPARYQLFDSLDGLTGRAPQMRPLPSVVRGTDGLLWFATTNGVVSIDPNDIPVNRVVPPVAITAALADSRTLAWKDTAVLPKGTQDLELRYTALSLAIPERVQFRYQLEGFDASWQDAGTRRQAFYPHLPPGHYVFHVIASNNDGLWNEVGAALPLELPPTFIQSVYFKMLLAALALAVLWALYLWRVRQATARVRTRLYERFSERERIARDLHDTFFQGIQGLLLSVQTVSRRLPAGDPVRDALESTLEQSDQVMLQGRQLVLDLRTQSTETLELARDLEAAAQVAARGAPATFEMAVQGQARPLNALVSEELYKIGGEAINNAYRHANAARITTEIRYGNSDFRLCIRDDGGGIAPDVLARGGIEHHFGIPGMHERAAKIGARITIRSATGGGTEIVVRLSARLAYRRERER